MSRTRRHFTAEQKAEVVRRHLGDKVPVSDLAEELGVQPTLIHSWVKQVLDHAARAFERSAASGGPRTPGTKGSPNWKRSFLERTKWWPS